MEGVLEVGEGCAWQLGMEVAGRVPVDGFGLECGLGFLRGRPGGRSELRDGANVRAVQCRVQMSQPQDWLREAKGQGSIEQLAWWMNGHQFGSHLWCTPGFDLGLRGLVVLRIGRCDRAARG